MLAVTGANGAVGRAILRCAPPSGLVAVVRSERAAAELRPLAGSARVARVAYDDAASLDAAFAAADAIVHLAGVLVEAPGSSYEEANVETTRRVVDAAKRAGAARLVLVSATGADPRSANRYWRSKADAEAVVRASGLPHTILRVPMLLGRDTEAAAALRRQLRRRTVPLLGGGRALQQPLAVNDLARAALGACDPRVAPDRTLEVVGPTSLPGREILERAAHLGGRQVRIVSLPAPPIRLGLTIARRLGRRGFSPDALEVLTTGTRLDPAPAARALGLTLTSLDDMIRESLAP